MSIGIGVTRIVNSCVLLEFGDDIILTDPWFREHWFIRFGENPGMKVSELPRLTAIVGCHSVLDHWDIGSMAGYAFKDATSVFVATRSMARKARAAGFRAERLEWGERRHLSETLTLEVIEGHRIHGMTVNNYLFTSPGGRLFFGGETRELEPLRAYRREHPGVDAALLPVNGIRLFGRPLVADAVGAIEAARILEAKVLIPIHDAQQPVPLIARPTSSSRDAVRLAAGSLDDPRVVCLETGERWVWDGGGEGKGGERAEGNVA